MTETKVRVRLDRENYEDVVLREIDWYEDLALIEECTMRSIDQRTMKHVENYDTKKLSDLRVLKCIKESKTTPTIEIIRALKKKDRMILQQAYFQLNEVNEDEKSRPVGEDATGEGSDTDKGFESTDRENTARGDAS